MQGAPESVKQALIEDYWEEGDLLVASEGNLLTFRDGVVGEATMGSDGKAPAVEVKVKSAV